MARCKSPLALLLLIATFFVTSQFIQSLASAVAPVTTDPPGINASEATSVQSVTLSPSETWDRSSAEARLNSGASLTAISLTGGIDHAAAGTGTRNTGFGTIRLRGLPSGATVIVAYLYWATIYQSPAPFSANANFKGTVVSGQLKGAVTQPCWNPAGVFASYRADVTSLISAGIDGDYKVASLASHLTDGSDPWSGTGNTTLPLSEGATLLVIYSHSSIPPSGQVYLYEDPVYFAGTVNVTQTLNPALPSYTVLKQTRVGADGQIGAGIKPTATITDEKTYVGPNTSSLTQIRGRGTSRNYSPDWNGFDGGPMNQLWDTNTDDIAGTLAAGLGSYVTKYVSNGDCIVLVVQALSPH